MFLRVKFAVGLKNLDQIQATALKGISGPCEVNLAVDFLLEPSIERLIGDWTVAGYIQLAVLQISRSACNDSNCTECCSTRSYNHQCSVCPMTWYRNRDGSVLPVFIRLLGSCETGAFLLRSVVTAPIERRVSSRGDESTCQNGCDIAALSLRRSRSLCFQSSKGHKDQLAWSINTSFHTCCSLAEQKLVQNSSIWLLADLLGFRGVSVHHKCTLLLLLVLGNNLAPIEMGNRSVKLQALHVSNRN